MPAKNSISTENPLAVQPRVSTQGNNSYDIPDPPSAISDVPSRNKVNHSDLDNTIVPRKQIEEHSSPYINLIEI